MSEKLKNIIMMIPREASYAMIAQFVILLLFEIFGIMKIIDKNLVFLSVILGFLGWYRISEKEED